MIKLLIVEDSEETVDLIRLILSNETDIKVSDANTIKDGMNLVKKDIFDLILLDLSLPDGNGTYICEQVRKFPELYGKPFIIALTADTSQESVNKNLELGCDDYIKKPFDTQELLIRLRKFIKRLPQNKEVITYENIKLFLTNKTALYNEEFVDLSKNEFEVLHYFIINKGLKCGLLNLLYLWYNRIFENKQGCIRYYAINLLPILRSCNRPILRWQNRLLRPCSMV